MQSRTTSQNFTTGKEVCPKKVSVNEIEAISPPVPPRK